MRYTVTIGATRFPEMSEELAKRTVASANEQGLEAKMIEVQQYRVILGTTRMPAMSRELAEQTAASARRQGLKATIEKA